MSLSPLLGEKLKLSRPPPIAEPEPQFQSGTIQFTNAKNNTKNVMKLPWPKRAISIDLERQIEVRKWKSII